MLVLRTLEVRALGYAIERVEECDPLGVDNASWFEVLCPYSGAVLGCAPTRLDAERIVIRRELDSARRAIALNGGTLAA
jgi:hypothetical protein